MSLVAYASSDEESSEEDEQVNGYGENNTNLLSGHISDEDEFESSENTNLLRDDKTLNLPISKDIKLVKQKQEDDYKEPRPLFDKLPAPKSSVSSNIVEEDDEFLHKKAEPLVGEKPPPPPVKVPVKIRIPSLSDFKDLENTSKKVMKPELLGKEKSIGLLGILPKPKHEQVGIENLFGGHTEKSVLIPDSVRNSTAKTQVKLSQSSKKSLASDISDNEDSDTENDFFSLNSEVELPEVSANEINTMVAKRAAKMAEVSSKINEVITEDNNTNLEEHKPSDDKGEVQIDEKALQVLVGSRAKRRKVEEVQVVELSGEQVLPNKNEWLRTALASATTYQPRGVLVDEEPAPGTRKKHQITYLAHQAKANEQELQAMWAANRHTRRQTQSKYGF